MSNMSYCRFENTTADLRDCYDNLDVDDISESEKKARTRLIKLCISIAEDYGHEVNAPGSDLSD